MAMNQMRAIARGHRLSDLPMVRIIRRCLAIILMLVLPPAPAAADQQTFATPEAAVDALVKALEANDETALVAMFGAEHKTLVITGDRPADNAMRAQAAMELKAFRALEEQGADRRVLLMGIQAWPMPIPLVRRAAAWRFATEEGVDELLNRRIGGNERNAIHSLRAYLDAQRQYASRDRDGDGVLQYARRLASTPGKRDGLYWPAGADDDDVSPFGPLIAASAAYVAGRKDGDPFRGYHFRILTRQGKSAPGGAYSYVINGRMIGGFAMIAYPSDYGANGVMTFIVNHNGRIYEADLGKDTGAVAAKIESFNPGPGWKEILP